MRIRDIFKFLSCFTILGMLFPVIGNTQIHFEQLIHKKDYGKFIEIFNPTSINTSNLEFSPYVLDDALIFVNSGDAEERIDKKIDEHFFELSYAKIDGNGNPFPSIPMKIDPYSDLHEGPSCLSIDGQKLYFTRNNYIAGITRTDEDGEVRLHIYEARKSENGWTKIKSLSFNEQHYTTCHPTISADGELMIFSADFPDSRGGMDLYMVKKYGNDWSDPVNLGDNINSNKNELFPYLSYGEYLFFASKRKGGLGGLDIYFSRMVNGEWVSPTRLEAPINSEKDDFGISLTVNRFFGYFTSNREGGQGKDDIYRFNWPEAHEAFLDSFSIAEAAREAGFMKASISVRDASDNYLIPGAQIWQFSLDENGNAVIPAYLKNKCDLSQEPGNVNIEYLYELLPKCAPSDIRTGKRGSHNLLLANRDNYLVIIAHDDYIPESFIINKFDRRKNQDFKIYLEPKPCRIIAGQFDLSILPANLSSINILNLCDNRIDTIAVNEFGQYEKCLELGCQYKVWLKGQEVMSDTLQLDFMDINERSETSINLIELIGEEGNDVSQSEPAKIPVSIEVKEGSRFILENISYDVNKSNLKESGTKDLDVLAEAMISHPEMNVELISHTDSQGGRASNLNLSLRRALTAKKYLVEKGIDEYRILALGFGEGSPRNKCKDGVPCTAEEHAYNRRTEIRVISLNEDIILVF